MARTSKYTREVLEEAVAASVSIAGVLRHLGISWSGGMHAHISRRIKFFQLDTTHFTGKGHNRGRQDPDRKAPEQICWCENLAPAGRSRGCCVAPSSSFGVPYQCSACGVGGEWNGMPLILHVDHIDGNYLDCRPSNVRFLCPNCHGQTPSWAGRNRLVRSYRMPPALGSPIRVDRVLTLFDHDEQSAS